MIPVSFGVRSVGKSINWSSDVSSESIISMCLTLFDLGVSEGSLVLFFILAVTDDPSHSTDMNCVLVVVSLRLNGSPLWVLCFCLNTLIDSLSSKFS